MSCGRKIGPRPVIVAPTPNALFRRSLKYVFKASENDDEHKPIPIAENDFNKLNGMKTLHKLTCDNTVSNYKVAEAVSP